MVIIKKTQCQINDRFKIEIEMKKLSMNKSENCQNTNYTYQAQNNNKKNI